MKYIRWFHEIGAAEVNLVGGKGANPADPASLPVAIRSSATAEDLPTASFAGQQDTYLNVRGEQALLEHVRRCWASLWTDRAIRYRVEQGFDHQKVYVSVVVQAMVQSEVSGILFTPNPVTGNREEVVINASWGLGEAVVSGLVSPDTLTVNKKGGDILSRHTACKEKLIAYTADGGIVELDTPEEQRTAMALTDQQAAELTELGLKIEEHYGVPQDIEWGLANGKWYLLQARPITTLAPAEEFINVEGEYSRIMLVEIFPDALSPIFLSVVAPLLQGMFDFTFNALGLKSVQDLDAIGTFYNQPYFHRQYIEQTLNALSPSVRESMVEQFINPISHEKQPSARERDTMHFEWTRLFPPLRWLLLELGHPWCKQGYIERQDDIFYLHFEDLEEMVRSPRSFTKEVQSRKEAFELNRSRPWPDIILTVPSWLGNMASQRLCPSLAPRLLYRKDRRSQSTAIKGSSILRRRHARAQTHGLRTNRNERVARTVRHE